MSRETKFSGANGDREILIFPVQLTTSRIPNLTRLIHIYSSISYDYTYYANIGCGENKGAHKLVHGDTGKVSNPYWAYQNIFLAKLAPVSLDVLGH